MASQIDDRTFDLAAASLELIGPSFSVLVPAYASEGRFGRGQARNVAQLAPPGPLSDVDQV